MTIRFTFVNVQIYQRDNLYYKDLILIAFHCLYNNKVSLGGFVP